MAGFFDGLLDSIQNPLFLGGVGMMADGPQGMMQGLQQGGQFADKKKKRLAVQNGLQAMQGLSDGEREAFAADPEVGLSYLAKMAAERNDPMSGLRRQMAEAGLAQTQAETGMLPLRQKLLEAQIGQAQQGPADEIVNVNGTILRVPRRGGQAQEIYSGPPKMTPAETALDKTYAKSYEEDIVSGGLADAEKNLSQLKDVRGQLLNKKGANLTGPLVGRLPDAMATFTNPRAVDARERVEEVVQRNLRLVLGAQFTNEEGKRLIARAYNPALDEKTNAARLGNLIGAMDQALQSKKAAAQYYEQNGTLRGFKGKTNFSVSDFENAIGDAQESPGVVNKGGRTPAATRRAVNPQTGQTIEWNGTQWVEVR